MHLTMEYTILYTNLIEFENVWENVVKVIRRETLKN